MIAEEVGAVVPEVVSFEANGKDVRGVDYSRLTALLIEAVKQQQKANSTAAKADSTATARGQEAAKRGPEPATRDREPARATAAAGHQGCTSGIYAGAARTQPGRTDHLALSPLSRFGRARGHTEVAQRRTSGNSEP